MVSTSEEIRDLIVEKLQSLETASESIFGQVVPFAEGNFTGYPAAVVRATGGEGDVKDTARIERIFNFDIELWQEQTEAAKTKQEADQKMISSADRILVAFDQDKDLGGEVMIVNVVRFKFDFKQAAGTHNYATFNIEARVLVPSYTI